MMRRARGFTLLETLLVVAILALAAALAAAAVTGGFRGMELRSTAKEMAANLRYTRARAISTGQPQPFTVDLDAHAWTAPNGRDGEIPERLSVEFTGAREVQPAEGVGAILFFPDGAATGGRIRLALDDAAWDIDVAWLTGEVTVSRGETEE
ncbi:MAG TPA: GspH/FimT family pseudopilin [Xanthomonadaceae bacterium]|nr:GspH/FimT family pseudopilin [Xanthomonadaceae bacterium]